jgi:hypothetical protein
LPEYLTLDCTLSSVPSIPIIGRDRQAKRRRNLMRPRALAVFTVVIVTLSLSIAPAVAQTVNFTADLLGANERPTPADSTATGSATAELSGGPGLWVLTYNITYEGLSGPATVGHIHDAINPGGLPFTEQFGAPVHDLDSLISPIVGDWSYLDAAQPLTDENADALIAGRMYINIHSDLFPNGEIRGQLLAVDEPPPPPPGVIPLPAPLALGLVGLSGAFAAWKRGRHAV